MPAAIERVFLGWHAAALDRAASWILERHGEDLRRIVVALPGSRAARALREKLARRASRSWTPPRILTQGELIDEMVVLDRPVAGRLARTLAWARALSELPRERLELLAARPPDPGDLRAALALAETVRALHADLAQEGIAFDRLARGPDAPSSSGEARRFEVLAQAQERWRAILGDLGLADPHVSRFAAIDAGRIDAERSAVLVGVADMNHLLRRLVQVLGDRVSALVVAPEGETAAFDDLGCVRTETWKGRDLDFPEGSWRVAEAPEDQADEAISFLSGLGGRFAPEDVSIGICDAEVAPHLERRLAAEGLAARRAAGSAIEHTRPHRLLADLAAWLPRRAFAPYAALVRHPDLEAALRERADLDVPAALDAYHVEHLPGFVDGRWLGREPELAGARAAHAALLDLLGSLASDDPRPLVQWPEAVRAFIATVYTGDLDPRVETERVLAESLSILSDALGEVEGLPSSLGARPATAAEALEIVAVVARGESVPPPPTAAGASSIELLGWLELPLDDASALVVTGFQEGFVPRSRRDDPFLPDGLRRRLGLLCADDGLARDLYAATVLLRSKEAIAFVSGRRNREGDPRLPSRLAFHVPRERVLPNVEEFLGRARPARTTVPRTSGGSAYEPPILADSPRVESMRVTAFRKYLESPYAFYLEHVLGLETIDDSASEMDARAFGNLAHEVLEAFGRSALDSSTDEREIEGWLRAQVERFGRARYGAQPLPAVEIQLALLARRMALVSRAQALRAQAGWRIREVEWEPTSPVALPMGDGEKSMPLRGRIDRIDVHESLGAWAILDYKVGNEPKDPEKAHRSRGRWVRDLQLPLYTLLAAQLGLEGAPTLGYFTVGSDESTTGVRPAPWTPGEIGDALEAAREVVRNVRAGRFRDTGRLPDEPVVLALAGRGLSVGAGEAESESGEGDE